jgi:hypothetical protein
VDDEPLQSQRPESPERLDDVVDLENGNRHG